MSRSNLIILEKYVQASPHRLVNLYDERMSHCTQMQAFLLLWLKTKKVLKFVQKIKIRGQIVSKFYEALEATSLFCNNIMYERTNYYVRT